MKILIIGAKGNLGIQLQNVLKNHEVFAWDRSEIDVTNQSQVSSKILELKPEYIINVAAYNAVDKCETDESELLLAKKLNGDAVGYLADSAIKTDSCLIHFTSDFVFGAENKDAYTENDIPSPINKYGETKLMGETEIKKRINSGLKYYLIRTSKLFGPRGESEFAKPSFFDIMLNFSKEKSEINAVDDEKSCFTYTVDLANEVKKLIENKAEYGIYHITNSDPATWYEAVKVLYNLTNSKTKINKINSGDLPRPATRPSKSTLINTKLTPLRPYTEALKEYLSNI